MANSALTRLQLINFEVFNNANRLLGLATIDLPELKFLTADIAGNGIAGKLDFPTLGHWDSAELTLNWLSLNEDVLELSMQKVTDLVLYGAEEVMNYGAGQLGSQQVRINYRGVSKNTPLGKFEVASTTDTKNTFETLYIEITIGGKQVMKLDKINYIAIVNGVDYLADVRSALNI